jgi:hypothetical protein
VGVKMDEKQSVMWCENVLEMIFDVVAIQESDGLRNDENLY